MKLGRKTTSGKYIKRRKKKAYERPGQKNPAKLGETKRVTKKTIGGKRKNSILRINTINVQNKGKIIKTSIKTVLETPSNRFLARQNILTKGAIIETELGKVKITNRPTQDGVINGTLVE